MASTKEYLDFVLEQLSGLDEISSRAMMGEFILYYRGKVFGGIYDDRLLVKSVPVAVKMMPDAEMEPPYAGAKKMILVDDVDNRQFLCELVKSMWEELSKKKEKILQNGAEEHKQVVDTSTGEYRKYKVRTLSEVEQDYLDSIKMIEKKAEKK